MYRLLILLYKLGYTSLVLYTRTCFHLFPILVFKITGITLPYLVLPIHHCTVLSIIKNHSTPRLIELLSPYLIQQLMPPPASTGGVGVLASLSDHRAVIATQQWLNDFDFMAE